MGAYKIESIRLSEINCTVRKWWRFLRKSMEL